MLSPSSSPVKDSKKQYCSSVIRFPPPTYDEGLSSADLENLTMGVVNLIKRFGDKSQIEQFMLRLSSALGTQYQVTTHSQ